MARQRFTNIDRRAFYEAHRGRCTYCCKPVTYGEMELDHLVPVKLLDAAVAKASVLTKLHLPADFDLAGDTNILVSCGPCNLKKLDMQLAAPLVGLLHSTALRLAPEVARLREKYGRIVSTDRLVLNLVNALEAKTATQEELDALLWEYFGRSEFKLDFPVRLSGRLDVNVLSKADLEDLWERPVELWGAGQTGLRLVHDDGRAVEVHSTRDYADACRAGFYPLDNASMKMSSNFEYAKAVFIALERARPAAKSFINQPRIGLCDLRYLDSGIAPSYGEGIDATTATTATLQDLIDAGEMRVHEFTSLSIVLEFGGLFTNLRELLRADIDGDGIEEMLVASFSRDADGGTFGFGFPMFLGRKSHNELLHIIDFDPSIIASDDANQLSGCLSEDTPDLGGRA